MTPKLMRDRLLKSRPFIRTLEVFDGEAPHKDIGLLWVAYKKGGLPLPPDIPQENFILALQKFFGGYSSLLVIEDKNKEFKDGKGLVGLILLMSDGWKVQPKPIFFDWATKRNKLKAAVSFLQMFRYSREVGVCEVRTEKSKFLDHLVKYGVIHFVGRIPFGRPNGDEYIYSIRCRKDGVNS